MASASDAQVSEWQASNRMDHQIAAVIAIWAPGKERGTSLPSNAEFGRELDLVPSQAATSEPRTSWSGWECSALATDLTTLPDFQGFMTPENYRRTNHERVPDRTGRR